MTADKGIMLRFGRLGKAGDAVFLPQGGKTIQSPGQQLMGITLMPHVPDNLVLRRVKAAMQRHGQFHHAQIGRQVSPGLGNCIDQSGADLTAKLSALGITQVPQILRQMQIRQMHRLLRLHIFF